MMVYGLYVKREGEAFNPNNLRLFKDRWERDKTYIHSFFPNAKLIKFSKPVIAE